MLENRGEHNKLLNRLGFLSLNYLPNHFIPTNAGSLGQCKIKLVNITSVKADPTLVVDCYKCGREERNLFSHIISHALLYQDKGPSDGFSKYVICVMAYHILQIGDSQC